MLFLTKVVNIVCVFLYPAYASYKALSTRPESSPDAAMQVERWLMYWAVVGSWTAVETLIGWTFTWLPLYTLGKTIVFIYFTLPESQGASYIYSNLLAPIFQQHEVDIDHFLASLSERASAAFAGAMTWLWDRVKAQLSLVLSPEQAAMIGYTPATAAQPPTLADPASGAAQQAYGLFQHFAGRYMPVALSAMGAAASAATTAASSTSPSANRRSSASSAPLGTPTSGFAVPVSDVTSRTMRNASEAYSSSLATASNADIHTRTPGSRTSSDGSLNSGLRWQTSSAAASAAGFDIIGSDEAAEANFISASRPDGSRRSSSWFSWNGSSPKDKSE